MKKSILFAIFGLFAFFTFANCETETLNWVVDGQTYTTTTCESGGDIILPTPPSKPGYVFRGWSAFTHIEYLESTGEQYIDTGYMPTLNTKIDAEISSKYISETGVWGNKWVGRQPLLIFHTGKLRWHLTNDDAVDSNTIFANTKYHVVVSNGKLLVDDTEYTSTPLQDLENGGSFKLFVKGYGSPNGVRIYYAKIYDDDILIHDFIPVLDNNNIPCMYDKAEGKFYYNAGAGDFIAGPVIGAN